MTRVRRFKSRASPKASAPAISTTSGAPFPDARPAGKRTFAKDKNGVTKCVTGSLIKAPRPSGTTGIVNDHGARYAGTLAIASQNAESRSQAASAAVRLRNGARGSSLRVAREYQGDASEGEAGAEVHAVPGAYAVRHHQADSEERRRDPDAAAHSLAHALVGQALALVVCRACID